MLCRIPVCTRTIWNLTGFQFVLWHIHVDLSVFSLSLLLLLLPLFVVNLYSARSMFQRRNAPYKCWTNLFVNSICYCLLLLPPPPSPGRLASTVRAADRLRCGTSESKRPSKTGEFLVVIVEEVHGCQVRWVPKPNGVIRGTWGTIQQISSPPFFFFF